MSSAPLLRTKDSGLLWRDLNYDIAWEATPGGVIHCCSVLNRRTDIFKAVEGMNLSAILCSRSKRNAWDLLQEAPRLRHIEIRLPRQFGPDRLYLTAGLLPEGGAAGTLCALDPDFDELLDRDLALLNQTRDARAREEDYRQEADLMLQGLRVLLGGATANEKLENLSALAVGAIRGGGHLLLQVGRDGALRRLSSSAADIHAPEAAAQIFMAQLSPVTVYKEGEPHNMALRELLGDAAREVAVILLPVAAESIALVCASRRSGGFTPDDIGLASRFALILKQALVLKDEQDKLMQSGKLSALGQMSASLAHELRQPLNAISATAQNLEMMAESGPVAVEILVQKVGRILGQVDRASQIMDRIRRFSRKSGGVFAPADLVALGDGVRLLMEPVAMMARVHLTVDVEPGLNVRCDGVQIEQVLANLVRNALDALAGIGSAHKTENGAITIRGSRTAVGVVLRVEDNGPGFPADITSRPLETFFTTKSAEAGTGLGLSICHMIARAHAGRLELGNHACGGYVELHLPERSDDAK